MSHTISKTLLALFLFLGLVVVANAANVTPSGGKGTVGTPLTITSGGASQALFVANPYRADCFIQNLSTTENLAISFLGAASSTTIILQPYDSLNCLNGSIVRVEAITVEAATTSHAFYAEEVNQAGN